MRNQSNSLATFVGDSGYEAPQLRDIADWNRLADMRQIYQCGFEVLRLHGDWKRLLPIPDFACMTI
jgi:serine/threonine-protein kinase RIO1